MLCSFKLMYYRMPFVKPHMYECTPFAQCWLIRVPSRTPKIQPNPVQTSDGSICTRSCTRTHTHCLVRTYVSTHPLLVAATQLVEVGRALVALVVDEVVVVVEGLRALVAGGPRTNQVHLALVTR